MMSTALTTWEHRGNGHAEHAPVERCQHKQQVQHVHQAAETIST